MMRLLPTSLVLATIAAAAFACGTNAYDFPPGDKPPPASDDGGASSKDDGGKGKPGTDGGKPSGDDGGGGKGDAGQPFCSNAQGTYVAAPAASDVLFLLDRSGSMHIQLSDNGTRWSDTEAGFFQLLNTLPSSTRAGAMMFPQGDAPISCCWIDPNVNDVTCSCAQGELPGTSPRCDESTYQLGVDVDTLTSQHILDITNYVQSSDLDFYWGTPLAVALQASVDAMSASPLDGVKSVVLLTDGYPTSCATNDDPGADDIQRVIDAAASGYGGTPTVRTFVLGVIDGTKGARADWLSSIAQAGGTQRTPTCDQTNDCFYAINAATFAQDLSGALSQIALQAFSCSFDLPSPSQGETLDLTKVNVALTSTQNGTQALARDSQHQQGWDFLGQTQIQLYGDACNTVRSDPTATVDVVVGCKTQGM